MATRFFMVDRLASMPPVDSQQKIRARARFQKKCRSTSSSPETSALLADEGLGLDRCFFVVGRLVLMHRIVSQRGNRARKPPPSPRASHVSTSHPHPHPGEPRGVVLRAGPPVFLATPLGKHAYKRGRGAEHAAEACPARARSRCVTPSRHWSPTPPLHSSGRRAGWPHMASPLQLDHILNRPGKKRESRAKGSHPSNAGFGPGAGVGAGGPRAPQPVSAR